MQSNHLMRKILLLLTLATPFSVFAASWPSGIQADVQFESSHFMLKTANRNPGATAIDLNGNGAYGSQNILYDKTKSGDWFIDYQKVGMDAVIAGIYKSDTSAIERGLKIIKWGFDQRKPDGSYTSNDAYHTVSYFLATSVRALLHLENSKFKTQFSKQINALKPAVLQTADWLTKSTIELPGLEKDAPYTHRFYMNGVAIGFAGALLSRKDLINHSVDLVRKGLVAQNKDGSNPEKGGTDTSYQALGLYLAAQYFSVIADPTLRKDMSAMGDKGASWIASKILQNGDVDSSSNTRTGESGERRHGTELKTVTYFMIYKALAYWSQILQRSDLESKATLVFEFDRKRKH